ncbi:RNase A-like domain-containing protein [Pseudomonas japonica]|uniref:RNase A-like domain-containing protein n=1 Tax=Pseudomonas japonica TaxID=256466 RepID=UPI002158FB27|nr:RNase A-like domain-containing protein [Pseudomonas japonica]
MLKQLPLTQSAAARTEKLPDGSVEKVALHALVGGLLSQAQGKGFATGAAAAGANEALINQLSGFLNSDPQRLMAASQIVGLLAAAAVDGDVQTGANIAKDATAYNRLPHEEETRWLRQQSAGDEAQQFRLTVAACAVIHCASKFPEGSADSLYYKQIEAIGNSESFADARNLVSTSGLFQYGVTDTVSDALSAYQVGTRLTGGVQMAGGVALAAGGAALSIGTEGAGSFLGVPLFGYGADTSSAGAQMLWNGMPANTLSASALGAVFGVSPESVDNVLSFTTATGELLVLSKSAGAGWSLVKAVDTSGAKEPGKAVSPIVPGGGLAAHEAAGGHLLAKHVGQSEEQLLSRLSAEPKITGSSSFYDRTVAEKAVSQTLDMNQTEIANWLSGSANRLRLDHTLSNPVGISVARGASGAVDANSVRVILLRDSKIPTGYKILTGFPTVP